MQIKLPEKLPKPPRSNASRKKKRWRSPVFEPCRRKLLTVRPRLTP
jgi:hypothetical protein